MRLLLDQGLPRSTVLYLQKYGIEAAHVGDRGLATGSDRRAFFQEKVQQAVGARPRKTSSKLARSR